ncbi:hypothetical protein [Hellea balneolensis]|uniref:hypothetical protein n=1 Tax=Hellea balneolensis TaxID=287478 RepID=UPI000422A230|nr:hypothetical protein [Hellea balneolensis]
MAFREKTAWIMSVALLLGGVFYFGVVISGSQELGASMPPLIPVVAVYGGILAIIAIIGHVAAALTSLKTANDPMDERERAITARARSLADSVMGIGILISCGLYLLSYDGNQLFHLVFGTLMVSQFLHYAAQIVLFRAQSAVAD